MEKYNETIVWPKDFPEEEKKLFLQLMRQRVKEDSLLYMFYKSDCDCEYWQTVLLDRYPMSEIILARCHHCQKVCQSKIKRPFEFYLPLTKETFTIEEIKKMAVQPGQQEELIKQYQNSNDEP